MPLKTDKSPTQLSRVRQLNNDADEQKTLAHGESDRFFPFRFQVSSGKTSPLFEIASVLVRLDHGTHSLRCVSSFVSGAPPDRQLRNPYGAIGAYTNRSRQRWQKRLELRDRQSSCKSSSSEIQSARAATVTRDALIRLTRKR